MNIAGSTGTQEGELVAMIQKRVGWESLRPERFALEDAALLNLAFWSGKQRVYYLNRNLVDATLTLPDDEVAYQINLIRSRVLSAVARVLNVKAEFKARPESGTARDREIAMLSDKVFDHARVVTDFEHVQAMATLWAAITGISYLKIGWDPLVGEPDRFYKVDGRSAAVVPEAMLTREARMEKDNLGLFDDLPSGDLTVACASPFSIYQDSSSRDGGIPDCQWIAQSNFVDIDTVAERWDMDPKDIPPVDPEQSTRNFDEAIAFMSAGASTLPVFNWTVPADKRGKRTRLVEMWERPSRKHKLGRRIVYAGGKILNLNRQGGLANPYAGDRSGWAHLPFVRCNWIQHPGRFWGVSMVEDLISPQYNLNRARSLKAQFMETFGVPNTYVGNQSGLPIDEMAAGGGKIYQVDEISNFGIKFGPPPQMPPDIARFADECYSDLNAAAAQTEIEASALPGQMRSGAAIRAMNEDRYMPLSIPAWQNVRAVRDAGRCLLAIGKLKYGDRRILRYLGEDNEWIVREFNGASLVTDLQIVSAPNVTDTLNAGRAEMLDAVQSGAFNPQLDEETRELILSGLRYKTSDEFMRVKLQAKRSQEWEIQQMVDYPERWPEGYPVMEWENHQVESRACIAFMYTPEFRNLPEQTQSIITMHWKHHQMYIQQALAAQLEMQAALKGTPGQKGQASQPAN